jgi:hypothetical protein
VSDALTRPERAAERAIAKRIRDGMVNICAHCIHRQTHWGVSHCPREGREFPACVETPGITFEFDATTIQG